MGKGDIKSRKGKLFSGSFGVRRPKKEKKDSIIKVKEVPVVEEISKKAQVAEKKPATQKKAPKAKKEEVSEPDAPAAE